MKHPVTLRSLFHAMFAILSIAGIFRGEPLLYGQQSLDTLEEEAFQAAGDFAQGSVVQVETFGGMEFVNKQAVAPGPSTGTILTSDGWIVTSMFLFRSQPASITVILPNDVRKAAKLVARDYSRELAILKIEPDAPLQAAIPSKPAEWNIGQWTIALGKTFDGRVASRSIGILSATGRIWDKAIQTDCKISPQNYGGPLVDLQGKVMGILTIINPGIATEGEVEQWYDSGIGFAVPLVDILQRLPTLQSGQDIHPGKAGVRVQGRDEFLEGLVLSGVSPGSPAAKSGLMAGDKIVRAGSTATALKPVATHSNLKHVLGPIDANSKLIVEVERQGTTKQFEIVLLKDLPAYREPYLGVVTFREVDYSERVMQVAKDSPAFRAGITAGDVIHSFDGVTLTKETGLEEKILFLDYRDELKVGVKKKDGEDIIVTIQPTPRPDSEIVLDRIEFPKGSFGETPSSSSTGIVQLPLGDVKNKAFAVVPSTYEKNAPHGLLVVYAEAGQQDSKRWSSLWERFGEEHRWIVVVMQSADEKAWSFEEVEIGKRLRSYLTTNYTIDPRRVCIGGVATGGVLAIITAVQSEGFSSVWLCDSKIGERLKLPPAEPKKSFRFFVNGKDENLEGFAKRTRDAGYSFQYHQEELAGLKGADSGKLQEDLVLGKLQQWLRSLEAY
jgi:serine protease Do